MIKMAWIRIYPDMSGGYRAFVEVELKDGSRLRGSSRRETLFDAEAAAMRDVVAQERALADTATPSPATSPVEEKAS